MAKEVSAQIKLYVPAGQANPAPPVGPALGQHGVNIMAFCKSFNEQTKGREGLILPAIITVYKDKSFDFVIKTPPAAAQLMEIIKAKSGSAQPNRNKIGSVTWDQVRSIAENKMKDLNAFTVEASMRMVAGTARSMGITVTGDAPWGESVSKSEDN